MADTLSLWDSASQMYQLYWLKSSDRKWYTRGGSVASNVYIGGGRGFWYKNRDASPFVWVEKTLFVVNPTQRRWEYEKSHIGYLCRVVAGYGIYADGILWGMDAGYARYGGVTNFLKGAWFDSSVGCFVQLLWVGPNGTPDQAYNYGDGTGPTDDVVVDKRWIGAGAAFGDDGWFAGGQVDVTAHPNPYVVSGNVFFARFWSAPSPDWTNGLVPTSLTNRYVNGPTWTYPAHDPVADDFDVVYAGDVSTTLPPMAIPEPAAVGLVLVGLATVRMMRRPS